MSELPSTSSAINICELCNERARLYTCPRCSVGYCSAECYKSDVHADCSESFYKQCVEDEFRSQESDPATRQRMIEILKRINDIDFEDDILGKDIGEESSPLDSDDEEELPDLECRLKNVNLDNPNELWSVLCDAERQEFQALLKNGEMEKLVPKWTPWWSCRADKKLVQLIEEDTKNACDDLKYPALIDMPLFNELQKASPCIRFNIINVVYSYAYVALYYNGDFLTCAEDAADVFLTVCDNMKNNRTFDNAHSAIESVVENIERVDWLPRDVQTLTALRKAGTSILQGPNDNMKAVYVWASLSELYRLLEAAKKEISSRKSISNDEDFTKIFSKMHLKTNVNLSKKTVLLCMKKLEYYLSWVKSHETEFV